MKYNLQDNSSKYLVKSGIFAKFASSQESDFISNFS